MKTTAPIRPKRKPTALAQIPCANPGAQYKAYKRDIDAVVKRVMTRGWYVLGEEVQAFEKEFAAFHGVEHAIGVGSGTEALHLALAALGVKAGDEVITVSHTAVATVSAVELAGATPVLADIEPEFFTLDPKAFEAAITPKTKAVIVVHIYGQPADLEVILKIARARKLAVIEDCAQAHGARLNGRRVGTLGDIACFSFYPTKNLGAIGDGGAVITQDPELAKRCRLLREYGWAERYVSRLAGWNTRLDELQAAILRVKLRGLDRDNAKRARLAEVYARGLGGLPLTLPPTRSGAQPVYHLYVVRCDRRKELQEFLRERGIGTMIHYPMPIHRQPAYEGRVRTSPRMASTERASQEVLSLPMYPELSIDAAKAVCAAIQEFYK